MSKTIKFLDELSDEELYEFEKDLKSGAITKFINHKKEYFKVKDKSCSTCGNSVSEDCLVLIFGDPRTSIRKKAHFCGTDCMEYFMNSNIKKTHKDKQNTNHDSISEQARDVKINSNNSSIKSN